MNDDLRRVLKHLWFHTVMLLTGWLPDFTPVLRLRGWLARPAFAACGPNLQIARHVCVNFAARVRLGRDVFLGHGCWLHAPAGMTIGDGVQFAPYSIAITGNHGKKDGSYRFGHGRQAPIDIGAGTWIATHAVITAGCRIGCGVLVGANAVVTSDLPDDCVAGGVPARVIRIDSPDALGA